MSVTIRAIEHREVNTFIDAQWLFYKNDPNWVPPMKMDRRKLLDIKRNPFYTHAEIQLFLAERDGRIVGRIAAIINRNHNEIHDDKIGFWGLFESIDDQEVATALLRAVENWLRERGMTHARGPLNPSMNDEAGLLIEGFDHPASLLMPYNPPYYPALIDGAGHPKVKDLYAYYIRSADFESEKLKRMAGIINERYQVTFRNVDLRSKTGFARDLTTIKDIYNRAWEKNWGFVKMTDEEIDFLGGDLKQIADPQLAFFVETKGQVAGFILALPNINQALIYNKKGGTIGALWHLLTKKKRIDHTRVVIMGVYPEFRRSGLDAAMYHEIGIRGRKGGYVGGEAGYILEDNEMMNRGLTQTMHADRYKTYRLYEKEL
jgi:GNAT superfamily N-acetyltransferase